MVRVCERQVTHGGMDLVDRIFIEVRERNFLADLGGGGLLWSLRSIYWYVYGLETLLR